MENLPTYRLTQSGPEAQEILDQVNLNTVDIEQLKRLYQALTQSEPEIIEPTDTWPVSNPEENVIYRVIDRVNTPPQYYSDYMWNGTSMVLMSQYNNAIDNEPTANSNNLVKSGGVYSFVHANGGAYDISAAHAVGGVLATYDDLADALGTNGANVPAAVRKGGMSVKYVNSSDNKYVRFNYLLEDVTTAATFTNVNNWQGVDEKPVYGSDNLVESGGVDSVIGDLEKEVIGEKTINYDTESTTLNGGYNSSYNKWMDSLADYGFYSKLIPVTNGSMYTIIPENGKTTSWGFLTSTPENNQPLPLASGQVWHSGETETVSIRVPVDAAYLVVMYSTSSTSSSLMRLPIVKYVPAEHVSLVEVEKEAYPATGSKNLVEGGGVMNCISYLFDSIKVVEDDEIDITYYPDGYINKTNGKVVSQQDWGYYSDFIEVVDDYLIIKCLFSGNTAGIAFYSSASESSFICGFGNELFSTYKPYIIGKPVGANYMRVCYYGDYDIHLYKVDDINKIIDSISDALIRPGWIDYGSVYKNVGWIVYNTGEVNPVSNGRYTNYLEIPNGATKIKRIGSNAVTGGTAFYNADKTYISGVLAVEGTQIIDVPSNAKYVRSCTNETGANSAKLYYSGYNYDKASETIDEVDAIINNKLPQINDDITALKKNFVGDYVSFVPDVQWTEKGYGIRYTDGVKISINNDWYCTGFIPIPDGTAKIELYVTDGNAAGTAFYSSASENSFISGYKKGGNLKHIKVPDGAKYFRSSNNIVNNASPYAKYSEFNDNFDSDYRAFVNKVLNNDVLLAGSSSIQQMCAISGDFSLSMLLPTKKLYNYGVGGEGIRPITARIGSEAFLVAADVTIPSDTSGVTISFTCRNSALTFSTQRGTSLPALNPIIIDGVEGNVQYVTDHYEFARTNAGESVDVKAGDICIPYAVNLRNSIFVTALGYNGGYTDADDYMLYHKRVLSHLISGKYLFIGILVVNGHWDEPTAEQLQIEGLMEAEYGTNYWNVRKWLAKHGITYGINLGILDSSIYPTAQDVEDMQNGVVPTSLRYDTAHLTTSGYKIVNYRLAEILKELGYIPT